MTSQHMFYDALEHTTPGCENLTCRDALWQANKGPPPFPTRPVGSMATMEEIHELREKAMAKRHAKSAEYYNEHTQVLPHLTLGDHVLLQNQMGNHPNRWEKTGLIVETLGNRQYQVKVDGSNRITLRNHHFLRKITPFAPSTWPLPQIPPTMPEPLPLQQEKTDFMPQEVPTRVS